MGIIKGIKFHHYCNTAYPLRPNSLAQYELHDNSEICEVVKRNIQKQDELCLYVHVPFCQARCKFCEYVVLDKPGEDDADIYVEHLLQEIEMYRGIIGDKPIVGYDLGGGTPSYLSVENLTKITESIKKFNLADGMYLSVETTPVIAAKYFDYIDRGILPINDIADMPIEEVRAKAISVMFYFGFISMKAYQKRFREEFREVYAEQIRFLETNSLMSFIDEDTFMLTDYGASHLYGIIPLFYSPRSVKEMFAMSDKWLNDEKGEDIYLEKYDRRKYDAPSVAVDLLVFNQDKSRILLISRADHPYVNKLALPGGFYVLTDATLEYAAARELLEETSVSLNITERNLVKITSTKGRDPRGWVISAAYMVTIEECSVAPLADSDALYVEWYNVADLQAEDMAFDHMDIIKYALDNK